MSGRGATTPEERFALNAALLLAAEKRGGSGSSGRARRSLHLKIVGGFASELRGLAALDQADRQNLETANAYINWLEQGNTPDRFDPLPTFLPSSGPTLFPRSFAPAPTAPETPPPADLVPETPPPSGLESPGVSSAAPSGPLVTPREPPFPPPARRALGSDSDSVRGGTSGRGTLPGGRLRPPTPPKPRGISPTSAPGLAPFVPIGTRVTVTSANPLLRQPKRARFEEAAEHLENPLEIAAEPAEEAAEEILEPAEEAAEETLDTGATASGGVGPERERAAASSGAVPELRFRPVARQVTSLKVAEGLLPPGTSVLLSLDIHLVADRDEARTSACLERLLREHSDLAVIFCSYAVKQKTIDKAVQCIHRICDRTIVRRPLTFPIFFTTSKIAPGTGKGAQLSKLADIFSRSRPAPLTFLYHVDDQDPICKNVTSYGHHGVHWAEEDPRALDQIVWELCWL
ncbi:unnamed protein product [Symbiodinium sp. CCMP2592]|nr:unnamed protein product [Symbiodinium sp. CCMP2592]